VELADKTEILKKMLVEIYTEYLNTEYVLDTNDYDAEPEFEYTEIRKHVISNFNDFGWYSQVLDLNEMQPNIEIAIGDAVDDLTDIIKDLLVVKWKMDNTSKMDALWCFSFSMRNHSEQHLVDLLKYLIEKK
jgi:hypothetical protein